MDTTPTDSGSPTPPADLDELFDELIDRSAGFDDLDAAQREVWVSGLLASWRSDVVVDDPAAVDSAFRAHCAASVSPIAAALAATVETVLNTTTTASPQEAWIVGRGERSEARSVIISFAADDQPEHCLLAELDGDRLVDLNFAGPAAEVVPDPHEVRHDMGESIEVEQTTPSDAADIVAGAWASIAQDALVDPAPGLLMNQLAARSRLTACLSEPSDGSGELPALRIAARVAASFTAGMSDDEVADADMWASGVLTTALRKITLPPAPGFEVIAAARGPIRGPIDHLDPAEQQALCFLEWADWLGVLIGLVRAGAGTPVDPAAMVELINRCDEVSSTVPPEDREYVEFAFEVAVAMWTDSGVVDNGALTTEGHAALVPAALDAWS